MDSVVTDRMRSLIGRPLETMTSFPIEQGEIRRWAIAAHYPDPPPPRYWDEASPEARERGGIVAPADFNPFAWMAAARSGPGIEPLGVDADLVMAGATEHLLGVPPPELRHGLNGGIEVLYGEAPMRPGDVITDTASISEYRERQGRLGLMLFTTTDHRWVNQRGEHVKTQRLTYIRY